MKTKNTVYMDIGVIGRRVPVINFVNQGVKLDGTNAHCSVEFGSDLSVERKILKGCVYGTVRKEDYEKFKKYVDSLEFIEVGDLTRD